MIKNISIYLSIFIGFLFCFLFIENINILAYKSSTIDNVFGSYPLQMDIENYDRTNIYNPTGTEGYNCGVRYNYNRDNGVITLNGSYNSTNCGINDLGVRYDFNEPKNDLIVSLKYFYIGGSITNSNNTEYDNAIRFFILKEGNYNTTNLNLIIHSSSYSNDKFSNVRLGNNINYINIRLLSPFNISGITFNNLQFQLFASYTEISPQFNDDTEYSHPFNFGYIYSFCTNATSFSSSVELTISNNNFSYSKSFNVSNSSCLSDNVVHIPFNIDSNGYISLDSITINATFSNLSGTLNSGYYIQLTPILRASYKGNITTNLYSINRYTYNNLIVNGVNLESNNNSIGYITTNNVNTFNYGISDLKNPINVIYYNNVSEVKQNNVITINEYISRGFIIGLNSSNISTLNSSNLIFSFSGISTYISGQLSTNSPLPENELTISKYNSCSAWYDIPCQLGNAITYVIYEAPIISPVLTFVVSFITMFSSLVSFVDLFRSFGIVFGCFIIYMFIELLHKYSK